MWVLARGLSIDGRRAADRGHHHVDPVAEVGARAWSGSGVQSTITWGPVCAQPSSPMASTPRLIRWATHQSPAAARRGSFRSTTSSEIAIISLGSRPMSIPR